MAKIQVLPLFTVELFHTYYSSGISEDFDIVPTPLCQRTLNRYGLFFRKTGSGFRVFYETVGGEPDIHPLKPIEDDLRFSFMLIGKNPYILNYSNLQLTSSENDVDLYYLNNLTENRQTLGDPPAIRRLLTRDDNAAFLSGADRFIWRPQSFQLVYESEDRAIELTIVDELNRQVISEMVPVTEGIADCMVNLQRMPPGFFILNINGAEQLKFYADDQLTGKNIFGMIDIMHNDQVPDTYRFIDDDYEVLADIVYDIRLDQRETYWRYIVGIKYAKKDNDDGDPLPPDNVLVDYSGDDPDVNVIFNRLSPIDLPDGTRAAFFQANSKLSLRKEAIPGMRVQVRNMDNELIFSTDKLPNPSVSLIKPAEDYDGGANNDVYSEIYVYV